MSKREDSDSIKALHRMVAYSRDEAARLHMIEVAHLLERVEEAVGCFVLAGSVEQDGFTLDASSVSILEH